ncbi:MAG: ATP-dependent zinc protease [Gammaproteobacteria bacterium]
MQIAFVNKRLLTAAMIGLIGLSSQAVDIADHKIVGRVESALVTDHQIKMNVRMDTGAQTSSLSATDIEIFKKDGKEWVRFTVDPTRTDKKYRLERPLLRYIKIRKRHGELEEVSDIAAGKAFERRPVVSIPVCLGKQSKMVEVSLTDRSHFNYPMLMGRVGMQSFGILIDPTRSFTAKPQCPSPSNS